MHVLVSLTRRIFFIFVPKTYPKDLSYPFKDSYIFFYKEDFFVFYSQLLCDQ